MRLCLELCTNVLTRCTNHVVGDLTNCVRCVWRTISPTTWFDKFENTCKWFSQEMAKYSLEFQSGFVYSVYSGPSTIANNTRKWTGMGILFLCVRFWVFCNSDEYFWVFVKTSFASIFSYLTAGCKILVKCVDSFVVWFIRLFDYQ